MMWIPTEKGLSPFKVNSVCSKTYAEVFFERNPEANKDDDTGMPTVCRQEVFNGGGCDERYSDCDECWRQPYGSYVGG